jgi:hypothetical protein
MHIITVHGEAISCAFDSHTGRGLEGGNKMLAMDAVCSLMGEREQRGSGRNGAR